MIRFNIQKIMQAKMFLLLAAMLLGFAGNLSAEVKIYVSDFSINPGETKEIAMNLDTDETNLSQIRGFIQMPQGLEIIENSSKPNNSRAGGAVGNVNPETGQFFFSMIGGSFSGTSGAIFTFKVTATDDLANTSQITYSDVQCGPRGNLVTYTVSPTKVTKTSGGGSDDPVGPDVPAGTISCSFNVESLAFLPNETGEKEVEVAMTNGDGLTGISARLIPSEGLEVVSVEKTNRLTGWSYTDGKIMSYGAITGNSGTIFTIKLKPQDGFVGDATLTLKNIKATTSNASSSISGEDIVLNVHVIAAPEIKFSPAEPIALPSGQSTQVSVTLNGESQMSMYQAKLILPEGITAEVTNGDVATAAPSYNPQNGTIIGTGLTKRTGTLLNIKLTATDAFVANGVVELKNVKGTTTSAYSIAIEPISLEVNAVARLVETPAAKTLTYNGEEQALVEAGTASGNATLAYSLDNENFSDAIPTAKNAGNYSVYYKVIAGENQTSDSSAQYEPVAVTIAKAALTSATLTSAELVYNNQEQTAEVAEVKAGDLVVPAEAYTVSGATAKDKGEYTVTVTAVENGNFTGSVTANFTIIANAVNDEAYARLKSELDNLDQAITDAKAEIEEDAADVKDDYLAQLDELSGNVNAARIALEAANEAVTLTAESVNENIPTEEEIAAIVTAAKEAQALKEAKAAFDQYKAEQIDAVETLAKAGDSEAAQQIIADAKAAIEALEYDESKSLEENKAAVDAVVAPVADALEAQRTADQLAADKAAFDQYKTEQIEDVEGLAEEGDSEAAQQIIADAKAAIEALEYDESKSLEENKAAVDAVVAPVADALDEQRAADELAADKAAFDQYKADLIAAVEALAEDGDSEASQQIIADAVAAIEALEYDEEKTLEENKATAEELTEDVADALEEQRAADQLAADKAAFDEYKADLIAAVEALAEDGDSEASQQIIADAVAAIEALEYDEEKSLEENLAAAEELTDGVAEALAEQRAADAIILGDVNGDGKINTVDASYILMYLVGNVPDDFVEAAADVDGNGIINTLDATAILKKLVE